MGDVLPQAGGLGLPHRIRTVGGSVCGSPQGGGGEESAGKSKCDASQLALSDSGFMAVGVFLEKSGIFFISQVRSKKYPMPSIRVSNLHSIWTDGTYKGGSELGDAARPKMIKMQYYAILCDIVQRSMRYALVWGRGNFFAAEI